MCESNAYLIRYGEEELVMESVRFVKPRPDGVLLKSIFGEETIVNATIREMDLTFSFNVWRPPLRPFGLDTAAALWLNDRRSQVDISHGLSVRTRF